VQNDSRATSGLLGGVTLEEFTLVVQEVERVELAGKVTEASGREASPASVEASDEPSSSRELQAALRNLGRDSSLSSAHIARYVAEMRGAGTGLDFSQVITLCLSSPFSFLFSLLSLFSLLFSLFSFLTSTSITPDRPRPRFTIALGAFSRFSFLRFESAF
jgi:hypothetical protein